MHITEVETILLSHAFPEHQRFRWSAGEINGWSVALVRIHTTNGLHGVGEIYFGGFVPETIPSFVAGLKPHLIGEDPLRVPYLWEKLNHTTKFWNRTGFGKAVIAGIDIALHDLVGKAVGLPVYQIIGGLWRRDVRTYASAGCSDDLSTLCREVREARQHGHNAYKWRLVEPREAARFAAGLRAEAGPDFDLMVDVVQGSAPNSWSKATVLEVVAALAPYRPFWIEEPYPAEDISAYAELRASGRCAVAGGEGITCLEEARQFVDARAVDYLQPDATIAGGITLCRSIAALAYSRNIRMAWHSWGAGVSLMANLHLALATPSSAFVEYARIPSPFREQLLVEPLSIVNGRIQPPRSPGLGIHLSDELISRYPFHAGSGHSFSWEEESPSAMLVD